MWKKWRINPDLIPSLTAGRLSASLKMKTRNRAKKDLTKNGHDLVPVELDWSAWPAASASTSGRQVVGLTCRKCWIIFRGSCQNKSQRKASDGKVPYPKLVCGIGCVQTSIVLNCCRPLKLRPTLVLMRRLVQRVSLISTLKVMIGMNCMLTL